MKSTTRRQLTIAALLASPLLAPTPVEAAAISWGAAFVVDDPTDVSNPAGSTLHFAADFNSAAGFATAGGDNIINGLTFTVVDQNLAGLLTASIASGPSYNATYHPGGTGDQDLDDLLDSHSYLAANPGTAIYTLEGLVLGDIYQVQVIAVADSRACCALRTYEPDDGQGNFTTGVTMQRGLYQSVLGTFTADATTQTFQLRSLGGAAGNNDPGTSGLIVVRIPEPGVYALALVVAGMGVARRRVSRAR